MSSPEGVDFSLPADHPGLQKILGGERSKNLRVYAGCPEWVNDGFPGKIYPLNAQPKDYVKYYAQQFNSIELNASHYRVPDAKTVKRWTGVVPDGFKFCPKIHQDISHAPDISRSGELIHAFQESISHFGDHLGTCFMQMPPHFATASFESLIKFLGFCPVRNLSLELRHASWFSETEALNALCNYLYRNSLGLVITDVAGRRDVLHMRLTNRTAFIRFVANNLHATDFMRLDDWIRRLTDWIEMGLETLYFFIHTPDKGLCPELADYFIRRLNVAAGLDLKAPVILKRDAGLF